MNRMVCCPYCIVTGSGFMPMVRNTHNEHVCATCGHVSCPDRPGYHCSCVRCLSIKNFRKVPARVDSCLDTESRSHATAKRELKARHEA